MNHYWNYSSREAHDKGERDASYGCRESHEYDRHSGNERDRAYFDGYREEERRQEERREERRREEEQQERMEQRRAEERRMEERMMYEQQMAAEDEQYRNEERPDESEG